MLTVGLGGVDLGGVDLVGVDLVGVERLVGDGADSVGPDLVEPGGVEDGDRLTEGVRARRGEAGAARMPGTPLGEETPCDTRRPGLDHSD